MQRHKIQASRAVRIRCQRHPQPRNSARDSPYLSERPALPAWIWIQPAEHKYQCNEDWERPGGHNQHLPVTIPYFPHNIRLGFAHASPETHQSDVNRLPSTAGPFKSLSHAVQLLDVSHN